MERNYTQQEIEEGKKALRMRETDSLYRLSSSPLTYLMGGLVFTGATGLAAIVANTDPDTTNQGINAITPYFFGGVAALNYLMSGFYTWAWHSTKKMVRESENKPQINVTVQESQYKSLAR